MTSIAKSKLTFLNPKTELALLLAHEISQPLTAILAYAQSCIYMLDNPLNGESLKQKLNEGLNKVALQAELAGNIIHNMNQLLNKESLCVETLAINPLIKEALVLIEPELNTYKLKLKINLELAKKLPKIAVNKIHIMQVILNLVRNSIESLQSNPIKSPVLFIKTFLHYPNIHISIADNGTGIPAALKNSILHAKFTTKDKAQGLGLTICRLLLEAQGGTLYLNSADIPTQGSCFTFSLPALQNNKCFTKLS